MKVLLRICLPVLLAFLLIVSTVSCAHTASARQSATNAGALQAPQVQRMLVLGCDRAAGLTDSMFILTLNATQKQATVLQIPRDTYAEYTERDYKKLNGAMHVLGPDGTKQFLSRALGIRLDYFLVLDLSCVRGVVDAVGGVDVVLPEALHYSDPAQNLEIALPQGPVHLNGEAAEHFIRYRSGYVNADLGRLDAQKLFLQAFANKCQTLTAKQMLEMTYLLFARVQTDLPLPDALRLLPTLTAYDTAHIPMATLAGEAVQGNSGAWYYVLRRASATRMLQEYCYPEPAWNETAFDPTGVFDREDHPDFHKIYFAPAQAVGNQP